MENLSESWRRDASAGIRENGKKRKPSSVRNEVSCAEACKQQEQRFDENGLDFVY